MIEKTYRHHSYSISPYPFCLVLINQRFNNIIFFVQRDHSQLSDIGLNTTPFDSYLGLVSDLNIRSYNHRSLSICHLTQGHTNINKGLGPK